MGRAKRNPSNNAGAMVGGTFDRGGGPTARVPPGARTYSWDAENRLVGIAYPGSPGKATAFAYDGLGRRVAISSTPPGGGSPTVTSYLWCGARLCQARNASNTVIREYYSEGEYVPGSPAQPYYYGPDQLGTARRVFASASSAPAYAYDPYGVPLQGTTPLTDFNYAGLFYNADSGLYLTQYRIYDPIAGRWLSRDPLGEASDIAANLYRYGYGNPVTFADPSGLWTFQVGVSLTFQFGPFAAAFSAGVAVDTSGNIGSYYAGPLGGLGTGEALSGGISLAASNAPTICNLSGPFTNAAVGGGAGPSGSADVFFGQAPSGVPIVGAGATFGVGVGGGASVTGTTTTVNPF